MRLEFHPEAEAELIEAAAHYEGEVSTEALQVVAVAHQSRRPEFWRSRIER